MQDAFTGKYLKQTWLIMLPTNNSDKRRKKGGSEGGREAGRREERMQGEIRKREERKESQLWLDLTYTCIHVHRHNEHS